MQRPRVHPTPDSSSKVRAGNPIPTPKCLVRRARWRRNSAGSHPSSPRAACVQIPRKIMACKHHPVQVGSLAWPAPRGRGVHDENTWALGATRPRTCGTSSALRLPWHVCPRGPSARSRASTCWPSPPRSGISIRRSQVPKTSLALNAELLISKRRPAAHACPGAIGHTGFTGTSLWIDWEQDIVVLVTNRCTRPRRTIASRPSGRCLNAVNRESDAPPSFAGQPQRFSFSS